MASVKTPRSPKVGDYSDDFIVRKVTLRDKEYAFRELDVTKYDELVELCTSKNDLGEELVDNGLLRKLMTVATCTAPKLPEGLAGMPMRLANKLTLVAQEVNYGLEPEMDDDKEESDVQEGEPETEGEA